MKITTNTIEKYLEDRAKQSNFLGMSHLAAYQLGVAHSVLESVLNRPDGLNELRQELAKIQGEVEASK